MSTHPARSKLAERLAASSKSLASWRFLGRGPRYLKDRGVIRYRLGDIEAYVRAYLVDTDVSPRT